MNMSIIRAYQVQAPKGRLDEVYIPNVDILTPNKPNQSGPTLIPTATPRLIPAHHHILPLIKPLHKRQSLPVDFPSSSDPHVLHLLRQHSVPSRRLRRKILLLRPCKNPRTLLNHQNDAGSQVDRRSEVRPRGGEHHVAGIRRRTRVDRRLDGLGVIVAAVAGGAKVGDGEGRRRRRRGA
uniref:Uncharacterized protein n=1 Tax=Opuntia streptacantha TaxID=393608 RepID=A0A7C9AQD5_OPUST